MHLALSRVVSVCLSTVTALLMHLAGHAALAAERALPSKPNILVLLADDMGYSDLGFQGGHVPTPNLDKFAQSGVRLTQFYVQPVCTPTRACLMTGRYPFKTGTVIRFTGAGTGGMLEDERTLADALRQAGYFTAITGKWHLGNWEDRFLPRQRGFDHQYGLYSALCDYFTHERERKLDWHRNGKPLEEEGYSTLLIAKEASKLIRERDKSKPFFLYVPFNAVHSPQMAPADYVAKYKDRPQRGAVYDAMLDCMDEAVGQILKAIDDEKLRESTVILFFNDNGAPEHGKNAPLRGGKETYFEGGMRVPAVISWAGVLPPGRAVNEPLHVIDMYPTFIKLAGGSLDQPLGIDGKDVWPTIAEGKPSPHEEIVHGLEVIRRGDWKYIDRKAEYYKWKAGETLLFNIKQDPYEQRNVAQDHPDIVRQLQERLKSYAAQERPVPKVSRIPASATIYGESENAKYGAQYHPVQTDATNPERVSSGKAGKGQKKK